MPSEAAKPLHDSESGKVVKDFRKGVLASTSLLDLKMRP